MVETKTNTLLPRLYYMLFPTSEYGTSLDLSCTYYTPLYNILLKDDNNDNNSDNLKKFYIILLDTMNLLHFSLLEMDFTPIYEIYTYLKQLYTLYNDIIKSDSLKIKKESFNISMIDDNMNINTKTFNSTDIKVALEDILEFAKTKIDSIPVFEALCYKALKNLSIYKIAIQLNVDDNPFELDKPRKNKDTLDKPKDNSISSNANTNNNNDLLPTYCRFCSHNSLDRCMDLLQDSSVEGLQDLQCIRDMRRLIRNYLEMYISDSLQLYKRIVVDDRINTVKPSLRKQSSIVSRILKSLTQSSSEEAYHIQTSKKLQLLSTDDNMMETDSICTRDIDTSEQFNIFTYFIVL